MIVFLFVLFFFFFSPCVGNRAWCTNSQQLSISWTITLFVSAYFILIVLVVSSQGWMFHLKRVKLWLQAVTKFSRGVTRCMSDCILVTSTYFLCVYSCVFLCLFSFIWPVYFILLQMCEGENKKTLHNSLGLNKLEKRTWLQGLLQITGDSWIHLFTITVLRRIHTACVQYTHFSHFLLYFSF